LRIIRFEDESGTICLGEPAGDETARVIVGDLFGTFESTDEVRVVRRLLAPLIPTNIIAIGLNYRRHAEEGGSQVPEHPVVFAKLTSSLANPGEPILLPIDAPDEVDYEAELAVVIGKSARHTNIEDALDHVLGYTCANDVSARDCQQRRDLQWMRAKSFDTFCPLGPTLLVDPELNPNSLPIRSKLNGKTMQESNTDDMCFSVPTLISYLSQHFTLLPGTVILTGTPEGVGFAQRPPVYLRDGDTISVEIDGIGKLTNPVRREG
jgi:2-keto-4-pentenoate hydratase/2-oxohepta-3-ene-1,7-dioic acid hydratase in catechol pathway